MVTQTAGFRHFRRHDIPTYEMIVKFMRQNLKAITAKCHTFLCSARAVKRDKKFVFKREVVVRGGNLCSSNNRVRLPLFYFFFQFKKKYAVVSNNTVIGLELSLLTFRHDEQK